MELYYPDIGWTGICADPEITSQQKLCADNLATSEEDHMWTGHIQVQYVFLVTMKYPVFL